MNQALLNVAIQELPNALEFLRDAFKQRHPAAPDPTDAEVIAAFESAFRSSVAKDDAWLAAHPE